MIRRIVAAVALLAVWAGAARPASAEPHVLRFADGQDVSSLNILLATTANSFSLGELTMAQFFRFDAHGTPIPELVTEVPSRANNGISADGKTITFHLRRNVKWSDGVAFDARDVTYTYRVATDPSNNIAVRDPWTRITGIDAPDRFTVVMHFKSPYAPFAQDYFSPVSNMCILPEHAIGPGTSINQSAYNEKPIGIGPFRYVAYHRGDSVEMEANPYYWRGKPKLQRIVYKIVTDQNTIFTQLQTGELDLWDTVEGALAQRARALPGKAIASRLSDFSNAIFFNTSRGVVADPAVRRALAYATDRRVALEKIGFGDGVLTEGLITRTSPDTLELPLVPFDLQRANALLDAAGWKRGPDGTRIRNGVPLAIELAYPAGYVPSATQAAILHDEWGQAGVALTIHAWSNAQFFAPESAGGIIMSGKFDVALYAESTGPLFANVNGVYDCAGIPPNGFNAPRYCNRTVDALNGRYLQTFEPAARRAIAHEMQRRIDADTPAIVLYQRTFLAAYDVRLRGYHPNSFSYWGDPLDLDI